MTTNDFPRILTLLRKERGISQKQVAEDLGISQALLSHYEKGIRECGLNFVLKAADYYSVSCDFLLGRTPHRSGAVLSIKDTKGKQKTGADGMTEYHRRVTVNTLNLIYGVLESIGSEQLTSELSTALATSLYCAYRILYSSNSKNPKSNFTVNQKLYEAQALSKMMMSFSQAKYILGSEKQIKRESLPLLTSESLSKDYADLSPSLYDLTKEIEENLKRMTGEAASEATKPSKETAKELK